MTIAAPTIDAAVSSLVQLHGEGARSAAAAGVRRIAALWRDDDGPAEAFIDFCRTQFIADPDRRDLLVGRLETAIGALGGHLSEIRRTLRRGTDLRSEGVDALDGVLATFDPAPDLSDQLYRQKLAFAALLNLHKPDLAEMLRDGGQWTTRQWLEARIAQSFGARIPAALNDRARQVRHQANLFVSEFHVPVGTLVDATGRRWFEPGRKLIAHWLIREQVRACEGDPDGLPRQRALMHVMKRHIDGTIPVEVRQGSTTQDWDAERNTLAGAPARAVAGPERYAVLREQFHLARAFDAYHPEHPTAIARKFELEREIPETVVERLLEDLLESPVRTDLSALLRERLGRPLEAHDIYFDDPGGRGTGAELDRAVDAAFPDEKAFERALPDVLRGLGFSPSDADFLGGRIRVEIARGAGHAVRPGMPEYPAWLRTSRLERSFGWDGFDTGMHELGHNLEQLISTNHVASPLLRGVPNTACTEAFAFLYQSLGGRVLGVDRDGDAEAAFDRQAIETMLSACQIAGPSLLELRLWRWMYAHPDATVEAIRDTTLSIAADLWSRFYGPHFGPDPYHTLAAYQHMIAYPLYLPDYPLGHIISQQIRSFLRGRDVAAETLRICAIGRRTPDAWMKEAVGQGVSIEPMVRAARDAIGRAVHAGRRALHADAGVG